MFIATVISLNEQHKESPNVVQMGLFGNNGPSFALDFTCTVSNKDARLWQLKQGLRFVTWNISWAAQKKPQTLAAINSSTEGTDTSSAFATVAWIPFIYLYVFI